MKGSIQTSLEDGILKIILNRPQKKNAVSVEMYASIDEHLESATEDPQIKVVVFGGAEGNFTSGNDLNDFLNHPPDGPNSPVFRFLMHLIRFPKPLIAAVEGYAIGLGTTMLLHFDLAYAAPNATFQFPFVALGLVPEAGSSYLLPRTVGDKRSNELMFFAERFNADRALEFGLINAVIPQAELWAYTMERARRLSAQPTQALIATKRLLKTHVQGKVETAMAEEGVVFMERLVSEEFLNAARSLLEKGKA